ncbi:phenylalanine--tRNA ligase subunit alpha [Candidatus Falkowbacteria bacterium]|nr:phenylalanine--tRNA ligase subunit alpha [Candidatus Falkowbacteria bacterium]
MRDKIQQLKNKTLGALNKIKDLKALSELEIKILGRKGELTAVLRSIADLAGEEKKEIGRLANEIKLELEKKFKEVRGAREGAVSTEKIDVTLPGEKIPRGHLHPITIVQNELEDFFTSLGFMVLDGPELESDYYNFEAINIPPNHPARDMQDTFYINAEQRGREMDNASVSSVQARNDAEVISDLVLRTHTSSVQVRAMQKYGAPLKAIVPGRCFRSEATDVRHEHTFYQLEGFIIDKDINLSNMKAVLELVGKHLYGPETKLRLRPKFYPFVEPGVNGEVNCSSCRGNGCRLCKFGGWLEIVGAGLIHPNVLRAGGIDPNIFQGFAFGFGLNRLVMLKYGIDDIRLFNSGDLRFLEQF